MSTVLMRAARAWGENGSFSWLTTCPASGRLLIASAYEVRNSPDSVISFRAEARSPAPSVPGPMKTLAWAT